MLAGWFSRRPSLGSRGVTLLELLVALAVLGVMAAVVGLAWRPNAPDPAEGVPAYAIKTITAARRRAVESGATVRVIVTGLQGIDSVVALPNGSVVGAARFGIDPLSGRPTDTPGFRSQ